jgi:hypothetical protein
LYPLAEAELLWEKDSGPQAGQAMEAAISLNPSNAAAWSLLGTIKTAQFDFDGATEIVSRLNINGKKLDGGGGAQR